MRSGRLKTGPVISLRVEFSDTGPGIRADQLKRIFDPFFPTKIQNKGTCLGLNIACGIVKAQKGNLYVRSREGEGTTFVVELPIVSEALDFPMLSTRAHQEIR